MTTERRLNVTDELPLTDGHRYALRIREDLWQWIKDNSTGSRNSVINMLVITGINNIEPILELDSIYEEIKNWKVSSK